MAQRKLSQQNIRKLTKIGAGRSYGITIPISFIRELEWKERQKLVVEFDKKRRVLKIRDWKK
jgi:hypothetical protein